MTQPDRTRRARRRLAWITAASVLAHVGVFAIIGLSAPALRSRTAAPETPVYITLRPPEPRARSPAVGERTAGPAPARHVSPLTPPETVAPLPAAAGTGASPAGEGGGDGRGRAATQFPLPSGEARKILRASPGACAYRDDMGLNRREREACDDRFARTVKDKGPIGAGVDPAKRDRFDRTAARQRADREWRENPTIPTGTSEEQGAGHPAGVGPASPSHGPM
ncbi:MAG: hypothetical protein GC145_10320 [Caulobacter sp.]|nr:hypothetical protein [Caulobacter sp.]